MAEKDIQKIEKEYSPIKSGMFYSVSSLYYIAPKEPELFFLLANTREKGKICITKIILSSIASAIWNVKFDKIYVDGGTKCPLVSFNREIETEAPGITAVGVDSNLVVPIKSVGEEKDGLYKLTTAYSEQEVLGGDEIILGNGNSLCMYVRSEGGVSAPVSCEVRFYLE